LNNFSPTIAAFGAIPLVLIDYFLYIVWKRQWSSFGLLIAIGSLIASFVHILFPMVMMIDPDKIASIVTETMHSRPSQDSTTLKQLKQFLP
jgi:hypothetical protein